MSERPNVVLGLLLGVAAIIGALLVAGLLILGGEGPTTAGATIVAAFSACIFLLLGLENIPLSSLAIVAFTLASAVGLVRTIFAFSRETRVLHALPVSPIEHGALSERAGESGIRLFSLPSSRPAAFCAGLFRPRVIVSTALLERLELDEQVAVVCHELAHARSLEPLKCLLARVAARTFFWLPALSGLLDRYLLVKELAADGEAITRTSRPALAGALLQVLAQPNRAGAVGMADFAGARVNRLFDPEAQLPRLVRPWQAFTSVFMAGSLTLALAFPSTLGPEESNRIWEMLSMMSVHGLPGMLAGLAMTVTALAGATALARRLGR